MSSAKKDVLAAGGCPRLYGGNIEERASACHLVRFILVSILVLVHCVDSFRDGNRGGVDKELRAFLNKNNVCADSEMESFPINYISSGRTRVSVVAMSALSAATTFEWLAIEFEQFERQLGKTSAVFIPHKLEAAAGGGRLLTEADAQLSKTKGRAVQERSSGAAAGYFMLERAAHILHVCGHPWSAPLGRVNPTRVLANVREFLSVRDFAAVQRLLLLSAVESGGEVGGPSSSPANAPSTPPPMPPTSEAPLTRRSLWVAEKLGAVEAEVPTPAGPDFKAELESRFKLVGRDAVDTARWLRSAEISAAELADLGLLEEGDVREFAKGLSKTGAAKLVKAWRKLEGAALEDGGVIVEVRLGGAELSRLSKPRMSPLHPPLPNVRPPAAAAVSPPVAKRTRQQPKPPAMGL